MAIGLADGPAAGLAALDRIDDLALRAYHLLPAARAEFLRRLGRAPEAAVEYRRALRLVDNPREQVFLARGWRPASRGVARARSYRAWFGNIRSKISGSVRERKKASWRSE